jgi:cytochrome c oxidase subunit I+III
VGTAGFFLLLTVSQAVLAFAFGLLAIVAILWWLWASDQPPPTATADVGHGVRLPVNAAGTASHSWWAVIVLIAVDMTIFVSFLFTHIHLSMAAEVCPPPGAALPPLQWPLASGVLLLLGSGAMAVAVRRPLQPAAQRTVRWLAGLAMLSAACALGFDLTGHWRAGLDPRDEAWSASVGMLLGYQAFHVAVLLLMGGYVLVRSWTGRLQPAARATLDNTALMWHCVTAQGVLGALTVQLVPRVLG